MTELIIDIDEVAPMLNGSGGLKNMHFQAYRKLRDRWVWLIRSKTSAIIKGRVSIVYIRRSVVAPDWDNISASFKPIGDALVTNKVIEDDNPKIVTSFIPKWEKAKNNASVSTTIIITQDV